MVKNFIPNCDFCGDEIPLDQHTRRNVPSNGVELLMVALGNSDPALEFTQKPDGTVDLDTCLDCYVRLAFNHSHTVN